MCLSVPKCCLTLQTVHATRHPKSVTAVTIELRGPNLYPVKCTIATLCHLLETLLTVTKAIVSGRFSTFTLHHYLLLSITLRDIKWCQVSNHLYCTMHTPYVYSWYLSSFWEPCVKAIVQTVYQFCFNSTAVVRPFPIRGRLLWSPLQMARHQPFLYIGGTSTGSLLFVP